MEEAPATTTSQSVSWSKEKKGVNHSKGMNESCPGKKSIFLTIKQKEPRTPLEKCRLLVILCLSDGWREGERGGGKEREGGIERERRRLQKVAQTDKY